MTNQKFEVCIIVGSVDTQLKLIKTLHYNVWQAVTWNQSEEDGMILVAEERALQEHGARPYVLLVQRLLSDGWRPLNDMPNAGTFSRTLP